MKRLLSVLIAFAAGLTPLLAQADGAFSIDTLTDAVFQRMQGKSFPEGCTVSRADLRYVRVLHYDAKGQSHEGELVCNKAIADDLVDIFRQLYAARYPIAQIRLVDDYDADDERSMQANNTSCFCFRQIAGSQKLSKHAQGMAIDINPLQNPCVRTLKNGRLSIQPATAKNSADRRRRHPYTISKGDLCHRLFLQHGFTWGGSWRTLKDYQHFEK